ncbi:tetratricopeptide repeat protein [Saccharothrix sp. NRRL B-16348]|uniref:tetratricopeptide repeat protein n=1 Tax=Saccharothrix sp. NRRL B-16348 TaxID=1415542 RepID=UPI0012F94B09|nr:tetratricopeptide repeat protein [Saccharothrix sp. NRRL B-16348]
MTADSKAAIDLGLADLAVAVVPQVAELPLEQRTEMDIRWLTTHTGWLLVLDNLTSPADAAGLLARVRTGVVVITSRRGSGWRGVADPIGLDVLPADEAVELMADVVRLEWPDADLEGVHRLCEELGWLPLAIDQAAAYIAQSRITPRFYQDLLARFPARMFTTTVEGGQVQRTMARLWHVTLDRLADTADAERLLRVLAWYASEDVPRAVLFGVFAELDLIEAMGRLAAYSMITLTADTINVHRLVQAVARTPDPADPRRRAEDIAAARDTATTALVRAVEGLDPRDPPSWPIYAAIQSHVRALFDRTPSGAGTEDLYLLLNLVGLYVIGQGDHSTAVTYLAHADQGFEQLHGPDHSTTLGARTGLAGAYWAAGDFRRAIPLLESAAAEHLRTYGPDHQSTQVLRNNLANAYKSAGDLDRAIPTLETAVADRARLWGPDHPATLTARNNLANAYHTAGDPTRAMALHEAVVADRVRVLGPTHPATLNSRHNLAHALHALDDLGRAAGLYEAVLADRIEVLGSDHPDTLNSKHNWANVLKSMGELVRAARLHKATLADYARVLGPDHPNTLNARNSLADLYRAAGNPVRAIRLYEATLADHARVLGPDHPDTLSVRMWLAGACKAAGDPVRAITLYEAAVADFTRVLGSDHPDTLQSRNDLADTHALAGDSRKAIPLSESVAADCARVLGPNHLNSLVARNNLANAYAAAGDRRRAILLLAPLAADCSRLLSADHPVAVAVRTNLDAVRKG